MNIRIDHVSKSFNNFTALRDVDFEINSGEFIALLGPSGCGKTTLLRIIAGLENASQGSVWMNGKDIAAATTRERGVGFVFQHYALFRHMTVFDNIAFGLRVRPAGIRPSAPEIQKRVVDLLELVRLKNFARRYPSQLSGGQRQRVALARALAIEPKILLLDEPFGSLDARVRKELRQWLRGLHDRLKMTSIFVTHDQEEALEVADRVVVMNEGKVEQIGTPNEVYHRPASPFVFDFLGNVNLFHCRLEGGKAYLADTNVPVGSSVDTQARSAKIYIRPHLLDVERIPTKESFPAKIHWIHAAGPIVRLELLTRSGQSVHVELSQEKHELLQLKKDEEIYVHPKFISVFPNEWESGSQGPVLFYDI